MEKPTKPTPDFPLYANSNGQWCKKIDKRKVCFGAWANPQAALDKYNEFLTGKVAAKPASIKPAAKKPRKDFPLFAHPNGQWAKKVRNKCYYFGPLDNPTTALNKWLADKDELLAGRKPIVDRSGVTVGDLVNEFLGNRKGRVDSGELKQRTLADYGKICERVAKVFGFDTPVANLRPADFEKLRADFATTHGPVALGGDIQRVRVLFNFCDQQFEQRVRYGASFNKPSKAVLRQERASKPKRLFTRDEIRDMLDAALPNLKAMILLGINCGFGNHDCAVLTEAHLDLDAGWQELPRDKTGIERRSPLWAETVEALRETIARRPRPKNPKHASRVFLTVKGGEWVGSEKNNPISKEMAKVMAKLSIHSEGRSFYALRHTFFTIGKRAGDQITLRRMMGHVAESDDMGDVYDEHTFEEDVVKISTFLRSWLFAPRVSNTDEPSPAPSDESELEDSLLDAV